MRKAENRWKYRSWKGKTPVSGLSNFQFSNFLCTGTRIRTLIKGFGDLYSNR